MRSSWLATSWSIACALDLNSGDAERIELGRRDASDVGSVGVAECELERRWCATDARGRVDCRARCVRGLVAARRPMRVETDMMRTDASDGPKSVRKVEDALQRVQLGTNVYDEACTGVVNSSGSRSRRFKSKALTSLGRLGPHPRGPFGMPKLVEGRRRAGEVPLVRVLEGLQRYPLARLAKRPRSSRDKLEHDVGVSEQ